MKIKERKLREEMLRDLAIFNETQNVEIEQGFFEHVEVGDLDEWENDLADADWDALDRDTMSNDWLDREVA